MASSAAAAVCRHVADISDVLASAGGLNSSSKVEILNLLEEIYVCCRDLAEAYVSLLSEAESATKRGEPARVAIELIERAHALLTHDRRELMLTIKAARKNKLPGDIRSFFWALGNIFVAAEGTPAVRGKNPHLVGKAVHQLKWLDAEGFPPNYEGAVARELKRTMASEWEGLSQRYHNLRLIIQSANYR